MYCVLRDVLLRTFCVPEPDPGAASYLREATAAPDGAAARGVLQGQRLHVSSADQFQRPRYEQGAAGQYTLPSSFHVLDSCTGLIVPQRVVLKLLCFTQ